MTIDSLERPKYKVTVYSNGSEIELFPDDTSHFKGTVGTGGTVESVPANPENCDWYIVIDGGDLPFPSAGGTSITPQVGAIVIYWASISGWLCTSYTGGGGGGDYTGSEYISISSSNVISARVQEISDTVNSGLVTNSDARDYIESELTGISAEDTVVSVSGTVFNGYASPSTASVLGPNTTFTSATAPDTKYRLTTDTITKMSGSTSVTGVSGSTSVTGVDPSNTASVTGVSGSTSVTGVDPSNTASAVNTSASYSTDIASDTWTGSIYGTYTAASENLTIGYNNGNNICGTATRTAFSTVTVPIKASSATTVPIADSTATTVPIKNQSATTVPITDSTVTVLTAGSSMTVVTGIEADSSGVLAGSSLSTTTTPSSADTVTVLTGLGTASTTTATFSEAGSGHTHNITH